MRLDRLGVVALGFVLSALVGLNSCGSSQSGSFGPGGGSGSGSGGGDDAGDDSPSASSGAGGPGCPMPPCLGAFQDGGSQLLPDGGIPPAVGTFVAGDCAGCKFPDKNATSCSSSAPAIQVRYPIDGVLLPPNMATISVQWTPFGGYSTYEVDFANSTTDVRIITKCSAQTMDTSETPAQSGGCEFVLNTGLWNFLANPNRGGSAVTATVRGTTDGKCASTSANSVRMLFAEEDLLGDIYYWKSTVTSTGTGGQIWVKSFGDLTPEQQITGPNGSVSAVSATCNGCHALSRDGLRMVVYSDDADSDDEYSDVSGSLIDMQAKNTLGTAAGGGGGGGFGGGRGGQPPGFSTLSPSHTLYLTSDGANTAPTNTFALWNGNTGMTVSTINVGTNAADRPTMPDWSFDGKSVVYVLPNKVAAWSGGVGGNRNDDDHEFGGSLYTLPYSGNQMFGTPSVFLASKGENNYYPGYSPDGQFIVFDRAPKDPSVSAIDGCVMTPHALCPNDSFSNPAARLMLTPATAAAPIDLEKANGSPAAAPQGLSNSWPRWSPFVQMYHGNRLLWLAFSSTRDYGVRVRNHLSGMYQCYPPDSEELPGGAHGTPFDPLCQQPKLWMAGINLSESQGTDPSFPAFFLLYQDIGTHNHTPQWTQQTVVKKPPPPTGCFMMGTDCTTNPSACCAPNVCTGNGTCGQIVN